MDLYTHDEANFLIEYFSDKLFNKTLEESTQSKIKYLEKEPYGNDKFRVVARGTIINGIIHPKRSIDLVLKDLIMESPKDALSKRLLP